MEVQQYEIRVKLMCVNEKMEVKLYQIRVNRWSQLEVENTSDLTRCESNIRWKSIRGRANCLIRIVLFRSYAVLYGHYHFMFPPTPINSHQSFRCENQVSNTFSNLKPTPTHHRKKECSVWLVLICISI